MATLEILIALFGSGFLSAFLALFYRFGRNQERVDNSFRSIEDRLKSFEDRLKSVEDRIKSIEDRFKSFEDRLKSVEDKIISLNEKVNKIQCTVSDLDRRLYAVETVLHMKDCCVLKQDQNLKKAE